MPGFSPRRSRPEAALVASDGAERPVIRPRSRPRPEKRLYTLEEAGRYLGLGIWAVRGLIYRGEIPFVRASGGKRHLLDAEDLDAWVSRNKTRKAEPWE